MNGTQLLHTGDRHKLAGHTRKMSEEQLKFMKEHEGHEKMHAEMLFIMLFTIVLAQVQALSAVDPYLVSFDRISRPLAIFYVAQGFSWRCFSGVATSRRPIRQ